MRMDSSLLGQGYPPIRFGSGMLSALEGTRTWLFQNFVPLSQGEQANPRISDLEKMKVQETRLPASVQLVGFQGRGVAQEQFASASDARFCEEFVTQGTSKTKDRKRAPWEVTLEASELAPREAWEKVPSDLSKHLDEYLYGQPRKN
ncbi:hypothetical protein MYX78_08090 [Acidobacteria bacterium AH-259-G07]|nr:hypothetical protein [Acidobacteria bacterium AH-259-G07]